MQDGNADWGDLTVGQRILSYSNCQLELTALDETVSVASSLPFEVAPDMDSLIVNVSFQGGIFGASQFIALQT